MTHEPVTSTSTAPAARIRPYYWSVRRELWENRSIYLAPLAVAGVALFGFLIASFHLPRTLRAAEAARATLASGHAAPAALKAARWIAHAAELPYDAVAGVVFVTALVVGVFYGVGALYGERRDRTILFWKSLPVSDFTTVAAKATLPLVILPVVVFVTAFLSHLLMLAWSALVLAANGVPFAALTDHLPIPMIWFGLARGMLVIPLWYAPIMGWLMLVSGWARRVPILWALGPWAALCIVERLAFNAHVVFDLLQGRLAGGLAAAFTIGGQGKDPIHTLADLDLTPVLANPELWIGLAIAAAFFAATVRLRRYREPI